MDIRQISLAFVAILTSSACADVPKETGSRLGPSVSIPTEWRPLPAARHGGVFVVWIFRTRDCLECQGLDYEFRRVQAVHGRAVPLMAIHIGREQEETVARAFLTSNRIVASLVTVTPSEFRRRFGDSDLPSVHLVREELVVWSASDFGPKTSLASRLDSALVALRHGSSAVRVP